MEVFTLKDTLNTCGLDTARNLQQQSLLDILHHSSRIDSRTSSDSTDTLVKTSVECSPAENCEQIKTRDQHSPVTEQCIYSMTTPAGTI